ncbi:MAG: MinD/ParA family protein [bacterium]|nr:MinD/ParA family protein [bacterium]
MATLVSVGSGKGGVGKSVIVASLGAALAHAGRRVILADLDVGGANLATMFGVFDAPHDLDDFWARRVGTLGEVVHPIATRLGLIPGAGETLATANPSYGAKSRLLRALGKLEADIVLVDVGAGSGFHALDFFLAGEIQVLVAVPEPPAILDAYRFVKLAGIRAVSRAMPGRSADKREVQTGSFEDAQSLLEGLDTAPPEVRDRARSALERVKPCLVVNRSAGRDIPIVRLRQTVRKFLGGELPILGNIPEDQNIPRAVQQFLPVIDAYPRSAAAVALEHTTSALLARIHAMESPTVRTPNALEGGVSPYIVA